MQRELEVLSEQYSQKCLENAHLAQALEAERQALRQCQRENQELNAHNQVRAGGAGRVGIGMVWLDVVILEAFSSVNDSMVPCHHGIMSLLPQAGFLVSSWGEAVRFVIKDACEWLHKATEKALSGANKMSPSLC